MNLGEDLLKAIEKSGYDTPTPIQARMIPCLLDGRDALGQAQTGTGKTAAFALPLLKGLDPLLKAPQVLVLTPTRELAIQVAESFKVYGSHIKGLVITPIYGGSGFREQFKDLDKGAHVVVGTPGRVMDHIRRGSLDLSVLRAMVLDEADEMLKMGFIEDVEWILDQTPDDRQLALFSATLPPVIRALAAKYLNNPSEITIKGNSVTIDAIDQRYGIMRRSDKLEALLNILEAEEIEGVIIFVRTREATVELAEALQDAGHSAAPINGDLAQRQREKTIEQLKAGKIEILVATDVAARGLDVDRVSHVINYDIPFDSEAYIHRIGRTGRAGRKGSAILFVEPGERRILQSIERATAQKIAPLDLPTAEKIKQVRTTRLHRRIAIELDKMKSEDLEFFRGILSEYVEESGIDPMDVAAALLRISRECEPPAEGGKTRSYLFTESFDGRSGSREKQTYRVEIGYNHGARPGNILGAIVNESELDASHVGRIELYDDFSAVDLPFGMSPELVRLLGSIRISGRRLNLTLCTEPLPPKNSRGRGAGPGRGDFGRPGGGGFSRNSKPHWKDSPRGSDRGGRKPRDASRVTERGDYEKAPAATKIAREQPVREIKRDTGRKGKMKPSGRK
jgi:ATP-dependent RNA helicase DeaD